MDDIGWTELEVRAGLSRSFGRDLEQQTARPLASAGSHAGTRFGSALGSKAGTAARDKLKETAKYIVAPLVGAFAVEKIGEVVGESIRLASDLAESQNKVQQVFGKSAGLVFKFTSGADRRIGQTNQQARDAAATFGIFGHAADLNDRKSAKFSIRMTRLASDLASFHNTSPEQAIEAIGAALRGETEPIRAYGVLLNQAGLKAEAVRMGLLKTVRDQPKIRAAQVKVIEDQKAYNAAVADSGPKSLVALKAQAALGTAQEALRKATEGTVPPLTQQQQVLAAQSLIFRQTKVAQGDFARTSGGLANQQRILSATWKDSEAALGKGLLPVVTDFVKYTNRHLIPAVSDGAHWFEKKGAPAIGHFTDEAKPLVKSVLPALKDGLHAVERVTRRLAPDVASIISSFTKLPKPIQDALVVGAGAAYLGKKTGLLGVGMKALSHGAGGGIASDVLSKGGSPAHPLYVWTVNGGGKGPGGIVPTTPGDVAGQVDNLLKRVPFLPSLAVGAQLAHGVNSAVDSYRRRGVTPTPTDPKALAASGLGGAQGLQVDHGKVKVDIDFDRLAASLTRYGAKSPYANQLLGQLKTGASDTGGGFFGNNAVSKDQAAIRALQDAMTRAGTGIHPRLVAVGNDLDQTIAATQRQSRALDLLGHGGRANVQALLNATTDYGNGLRKLPAKVQTQVLTPGLVETRTDIEHLQTQYKLTPRQVTTLYKLLGLEKARADFDALQGHMGQHRSFTETIELASHTPAGINVQGDLHIHGDERTRTEQTRRSRQRANSDGVRRGSP